MLNSAFIWRSGRATDNPWVFIPVPHPAGPTCPRRWVRVALRVLALALASTIGAARASDRDDHDHDRARAAVQAGEVMPLPALLQRLARSHPGQVLELEFESEDGRWVYEVKLLQADGQLLKLALDASSGAVLSVRSKGSRAKPPPGREPGPAERRQEKPR